MRKADDFRKTKFAYLQKKKTTDLSSSKQDCALQVRKAGSHTSSVLRKEATRKDLQKVVDLLANELIFKIFSYLDVKSLLSCALTCKRWEAIANDNSFWKFLYMRHVFVPSKDPAEKYVKEPAAPLEVNDKYWKRRFIAEAKAERNKRFSRLQKLSGYTGVTDRVKELLEKLRPKFQLCITTMKGEKYTTIERKRNVFITSTLVQWYTLKHVPKFNDIVSLEIFSLTPIISQKDGSMLKSGPRSKNLIRAENCDLQNVCGKFHSCDDQLQTYITERGLLISVWKDTNDIAFIWASLHHSDLINKCLKSTSVEIFHRPHIVKPDDISRQYGLQGYKIHLQVCAGDTSVWDALYHSDTMNSCKCTNTVGFTKNNEPGGFPTAAVDNLSLTWKTDIFNGKLDDLLVLSITVTDINADVLWHATRPVICESMKLETANFHSVSDSAIQISHSDEIGKVHLVFHAITDGRYAFESVSVLLNLNFINPWFGTNY